MRRLTFFLKFYKTQKMRFLTLVLIFAFAASILSCSLLVYRNNDAYAQVRLEELSKENALVEGNIQTAKDMFDLMERVMTVFAFGLLGSIPGIMGGYGLFVHLSRKLCNTEASIPMVSIELLQVLCAVMIVLILIAFFGNFISGLFIYENSIVTMLYDREAGKRKRTYLFYGILEFALLYALVTALFFRNWAHVNWMLVICGVTLLLLFAAFYIVFRGMRRQQNKGKKVLENVSGISLRFLYARSRRDAILAATVSVGAIIICIALNILFDFSGVTTTAIHILSPLELPIIL